MTPRLLLPGAIVLALSSAHCGSGSSGSSDGPGDTTHGDGGATVGSDGGPVAHPDGGSSAPSSDAGGAGDAWSAPDVGAPVEAGSPGQVDITFTIQASQGAHAISPYIYGVNDGSQAAGAHATIVRSGGNRLTAYNWENNASNAGSDYQFENDDYMCENAKCVPTNDTAGAYLKSVVDGASAAGAATLLTVPIVDYVAADKGPAGDVRSSGSNYLTTRFKQNVAAKGSAFVYPPDATDSNVYEDEMAHWLLGAEPGAVIRWQLDNEPDLWSSTHAEVHPTAVTYAELAKRNIEYATAIKNVDPTAHVIGPVNYGWSGYVNLQGATDSQADGDFVTWWLQQMKAAEATAGKRLIDGIDLHWYPEATGGGVRIIDDGTGAAEVAAREQAPRSLWDSTYTEVSWITQDSTMGPINLIPREQAKIAAQYPGTALSFTEWNYGGGTDISGGIATADVLGIFGQYGVDMAMMWPMNGNEAFTYAAFDAFRSYDGNGAAFGDTSVTATTTDVPDSSIYASLQSADASKLVMVAINKATTSKVAGIVVDHSTVYTKASVYTLTAAGGSKMVAGAGLTAVATNAFRYTMPAQSVSVIVPAE
ncbi:MAG TPA: glycoside hydrolase family 44 protein [Polyangiaceae bacterium]|jgi:hypothetical protein